MSQKQAKKLRRKVYGEFSPDNRGYYFAPGVKDGEYGQVVCDRLRHLYQRTKKLRKKLQKER